MRSVTGCLTCRRRKRKCDEVRPVCGQCCRSGRACQPSDLRLRHHSQPSPKPVRSVRRQPDESPTVTSPSAVARSSEPSATLSHQAAHHALQSVGTKRHYEGSLGSDTSPEICHSAGFAAIAAIALPDSSRIAETAQDMQPILNPSPASDHVNQYSGLPWDPVYSEPWPQDENERTNFQDSDARMGSMAWELHNSVPGDAPIETDHTVAYLFKHFSEKPGKWLDLYFSEPYFQHDVPRKALTNPLLKYAVCAYAAKHLHRTRKSKTRYHLPLMGSESTRPWYDSETLDWAWYDARYYAQAITLLRENLGRSQSSDDEASMPGTPGVACNVGGITDEVLAAMTILCCYEYMSASDTDWLRHLSGTMLLLDLQKDREKWHMSSYPSRARRSIFWNFARQDLYAAFILGGSTRLDSEDLEIWRASGLRLDDQGFVMPSRDEQDANTMKDDMVSNALIWIFTKIVNYTAIKNGAGQDQQQRLAMQWNKLSLELDIWFRGLSERFKPYARYDLEEDTANDISATPAATRSAKYPFPCIWYSSKMCASTMQTYHLARILLLVHRTATDTLLPHPQLSRTGAPANTSGQSTISAYLENLRAQQTEIQYRSREICGIAMSSPTKACIYLHQTQTLFVAGQCLSDPQERRVILDLLRRVNVELGWETEYRVEQLLKEWGWK